jgi:hypothetical protein
MSRFATAVLALALLVVGQAPVVAQVFPRHTAELDLNLLSQGSREHWVGGYLPQQGLTSIPEVWMFDRQGKLVIPRTELLPPGASHFDIKHVTADQSGNLYAAGQVWSGAGAGTGAICRIGPGGKTILVIKTDDFVPWVIAATKDGDIWALVVPLLLQTHRTTTNEYNTLWHFDGSGRLLEQLLPRSTFGPEVIPTLGFADVGKPQLLTTSTRLGVYVAARSRWIEYDLKAGKKIIDLTVPRPAAADGTLALLGDLSMTESDNEVYGFFGYGHRDAAHPNVLYRLDKESGRWIKIFDLTPPAEYTWVFGADGDDLVLRAGERTYGWFPAKTLTATTHAP